MSKIFELIYSVLKVTTKETLQTCWKTDENDTLDDNLQFFFDVLRQNKGVQSTQKWPKMSQNFPGDWLTQSLMQTSPFQKV